MAELLVRVRDKVNATSIYLDCQCTKRGDVIVAMEDGHVWGKEELSNPDWRILKIPVLSLSEAQALCSPELPIDPINPSKTLQKRGFKFYLSNVVIPQVLVTFLADDSRKAPAFSVPLTLAQIRTLKVAKPPIADPAVIGQSPLVIG